MLNPLGLGWLVQNLSEELLELRVKPTFNDPNNPKAFFHSVAGSLAPWLGVTWLHAYLFFFWFNKGGGRTKRWLAPAATCCFLWVERGYTWCYTYFFSKLWCRKSSTRYAASGDNVDFFFLMIIPLKSKRGAIMLEPHLLPSTLPKTNSSPWKIEKTLSFWESLFSWEKLWVFFWEGCVTFSFIPGTLNNHVKKQPGPKMHDSGSRYMFFLS